MIYLQSQVFDHRECSVSLGWGSTQRNAVIRRYSALVDGALLSGYALIAQKWLNTAITRCKQLQTIALVLVCRCGMWVLYRSPAFLVLGCSPDQALTCTLP